MTSLIYHSAYWRGLATRKFYFRVIDNSLMPATALDEDYKALHIFCTKHHYSHSGCPPLWLQHYISAIECLACVPEHSPDVTTASKACPRSFHNTFMWQCMRWPHRRYLICTYSAWTIEPYRIYFSAYSVLKIAAAHKSNDRNRDDW